MKILITGGAGFLGSHLAEFHLHRGDEVCVIDSLFSVKKENIAPFFSYKTFQFIQADITKYDELEKHIAWADRIYHMAAIVGMKLVLSRPIDVLSQNIHGCEAVLKAMVTTGSSARILIASSSCVYNDNPPNLPRREDVPFSLSWKQPLQQPYSVSKVVNELMALSYVHSHDLHCVIVRPFNAVGPRQTGRYGMVMPTFVRQALRGEPITVYGDGLQTRSFCAVQEAIQAMHDCLEEPSCKGEILNIGYEKDIAILELAKLIKHRTKSSSPIVHIPYKEAYGVDFYDVSQRVPILGKLKKFIGFVPKIPVEDIINDMIADMRKKAA